MSIPTVFSTSFRKFLKKKKKKKKKKLGAFHRSSKFNAKAFVVTAYAQKVLI